MLNKITKKDLINTFKWIISPLSQWTIILINYRLLISLAMCEKILFYYFLFCAFNFHKVLYLRQCQSRQSMHRNDAVAAGVGGESCDSFVPSSFPVGNSTWRRPLYTPNTILALDMCIYICFWRLRLYHAHDAKLVNVFPKGLVRH
jgi:hypothetical protein